MKNGHVFVPVFVYAVTKLIFQIKRTISSEKWCDYVVTFFFFFENAKNLGRSDDGKRRKNRGWPLIKKKFAEITTEIIIIITIIIIIVTKLTIKCYLQLISLKKLFSQSTIYIIPFD